MMAEQCIVVDRDDKPHRPASKVETHLCSEGLLLHRAFSVFLFSKEGKLLMQQRAAAKHTFPLYWTNTCCSHPLWTSSEMGGATTADDHTLAAAVQGAKVAALRKLEQELGITGELKLDDLSFLTRIHYRAADKQGVWGEHEIDYIFLAQADVGVQHNPNEIEQIAYMTQDDLKQTVAAADRGECSVTPWSRHIINTWLYGWWDKLQQAGSAAAVAAACADELIHRVGECATDETIGAIPSSLRARSNKQ